MAARALLVLILLAAGSPSTAIRETIDAIVEEHVDQTTDMSNKVEEKNQKYELHAGLVRAHSFIHAQQLADAGSSAPPLAPDVNRKNDELFDDVGKISALLSASRDHNEIYAGLLESMIKKRGGTPGTFEENRNTQIAYVKDLYQSLFCRAAEPTPQVFFVFGGTAVGKSSFVRSKADLPSGTVHINADDIRSLLVGNYGVYASMTGNGADESLMRFDASDFGAKDTNKVRFWVQAQVLEKKCNFLADSYSAPAFAVHGFYDAGYKTNVYYLEIGFKGTKFAGEPADFEKKVELSRDRIRGRISSGGHASSSADLMPDGFVKDLRLKIATLALNLKVPIQFYISQDGDYDAVAWPDVLDQEAKTSVDA